jgi:di/tricarboxylate transporter
MAHALIAWLALGVALAAVAAGLRRFEVVSLAALLAVGASGAAAPAVLFGGFGHPALITIVALYVVSQSLTDSGVLLGLGRSLERRLHQPASQVLGLATVTALLSAFMNNVGALALVLPTAVRMAARAKVPAGFFGLPLAFAAVLGGTLTLAGSAPNIIVSSFRSAALGQPFRMFDYLPHGAAICLAGAVLWVIALRLPSRRGQPPAVAGSRSPAETHIAAVEGPGEAPAVFAPLATRDRRVCLTVLALAVAAVTFGLLPPSVGFGLGAVAMVLLGVIEPASAYGAIDLRVVVFLGSMLGLGRVLEDTGALASLSALIEPMAAGLPRLALLGLLFAASCALSNVLNNAAAAVVMAPVALRIAQSTAVAGADAMLMVVAAGACLAVILPTHQVTLMALSQAPFPVRHLRRSGLLLTVAAGVAAILAISLLWP